MTHPLVGPHQNFTFCGGNPLESLARIVCVFSGLSRKWEKPIHSWDGPMELRLCPRDWQFFGMSLGTPLWEKCSTTSGGRAVIDATFVHPAAQRVLVVSDGTVAPWETKEEDDTSAAELWGVPAEERPVLLWRGRWDT